MNLVGAWRPNGQIWLLSGKTLMQIIHTIEDLRQALGVARKSGRTIGLVPTMGYLHKGHLELVRRSRAENDVTVVSIFVNPLQFGANEDLDKYPRDLERDAGLLRHANVDFLLHLPCRICIRARCRPWLMYQRLATRWKVRRVQAILQASQPL